MKHESIHKDLIFYLEGELSASKEKEIERHLADCAACREFANELKAGLAIIEKEKNPEVTPYFYSALKAKMGNRAERSTVTSGRRILQPVFFGILLVIGLAFGVFMGAKVNYSPATSEEYSEMYYFNEMSSEPIESYFLN